MTMVVKLTQKVLEAARAENGVRMELWDTEASGLGVRITPTGSKTFNFKYFFRGRTYRVTMGEWPLLSLDEARARATKFRADVLGGVPPHADSTEKPKEEITFGAFADEFITKYVNVKLRASTADTYSYILRKLLIPAFGPSIVSAITAAEVEDFHLSLAETPRLANLCMSVLSKMFNTAIRWRYRARMDNPVAFVERYEEGKRDRYLKDGEIITLMDHLDQLGAAGLETPWVLGAVKLALLTGMRKSEILGLDWECVHLEEKFLELRVHKTSRKQGKRIIPLSPEAVEVLKALPRADRLVFPGLKPGTKANLDEGWIRIRKAVGLDDVHFHDLRHTFGTLASKQGSPISHIGYAFGHSRTSTTDRYTHQAPEMVVAVANAVGGRIRALREREPKKAGV